MKGMWNNEEIVSFYKMKESHSSFSNKRVTLSTTELPSARNWEHGFGESSVKCEAILFMSNPVAREKWMWEVKRVQTTLVQTGVTKVTEQTGTCIWLIYQINMSFWYFRLMLGQPT